LANDCNIRFKNAKEKVVWKWIYDGDTLKLQDGRKLRLIGINTPELGKKEKPTQPYAKKAKQKLKQILHRSKNLYLAYDQEQKDKYGRTLAYAFMPDGTDIQARLIEAGLGISIIVPPNQANITCYRKLEKIARKQRKGLWKQTEFHPRSVADLKYKGAAYRLIEGEISSFKKRGKYVQMLLDGKFEVLISQSIVSRFGFDILQKKGNRVRVRGWLKKYKKKLQIKVFHPANIKFL